jgi:pimeloyl-ACP methyl ester carboxylesterase
LLAAVLALTATKPDSFRVERANADRSSAREDLSTINDFRSWSSCPPTKSWTRIVGSGSRRESPQKRRSCNRSFSRRHGACSGSTGTRSAPAIYVDPTWRMNQEQHVSFGSTWRGQLAWTEEQWRAANPRWGAGDIEARVESMRTFDPACIEGLATGNGHDHMPERTDIPALILVADPSPFITSEDAVVLSSSGFDVQTLKGTSHSMFREDFDAFIEWLVGEAIRR